MQTKHTGILRSINRLDRPLNILTAPTHEAYQSNWASLPHTFYLYQHKGFKTWNFAYRKLPKNHVILGTHENTNLPHDIHFDLVLSQNKFGQFQILSEVASRLNLPFISLEHTLPVPRWSTNVRKSLLNMRGDVNVFISEYSIGQWGFSSSDDGVAVVHHGINTELFKPIENGHGDGKILTVVNDWKNRDYCCNFALYNRLCIGRKMPTNPIGDTKGFSKAAASIEDLVANYQNASVFFNTSTISPVPTSLMEAMAAGCPVVSTSTCMIPEILRDGINGFCSNNEEYLYEKLVWCLNNPAEAKEIGLRGRQTIIERFSLEKHLNTWSGIFDKMRGRRLAK